MDTSALLSTTVPLRQTEQFTAPEPHFFLTLSKPLRHAPADGDLLSPRLRSLCAGGLQHIASGSVSDVYRTFYRGRPAALKVIRCGLDLNRMYLATKECAMLQLVQGCSGTVPMLEYDVQRTADGFSVLILQEYLLPLDAYCLRNPMTVNTALRITRDLCSALENCRNAGVAHLDIQPGNLFMGPDGTAMLGDFSSALPVEELQAVHHLRGTPAYMAPEVYRERRYSQASEVYSLGLVLYSLLCGGQLPFSTELPLKEAAQRRLSGAPFRLPEDFDPKLRFFLDRTCAYAPEHRWSTLHQMRMELDRLLDSCRNAMPAIPSFVSFSQTDRTLTQSTVFPNPDDGFGDWATSKLPPRDPGLIPNTPDPRDTWTDDIAASVPLITPDPGDAWLDDIAASVPLTCPDGPSGNSAK